MAVEKLKYERMLENYNNGMYVDSGVPIFDVPNSLNKKHYIRENIKVSNIVLYLLSCI